MMGTRRTRVSFLVFEISPPSSTATLFLGGVSLFVIVIGIWLGSLAFAGARPAVEVSDKGLVLKLPLYGRLVSFDKLRLDGAKVVNLGKSANLKPGIRTNGIGLPGYQVGWFRTHDGQKALVAITDRDRVLYLPTSEGYILLLSVDDGAGLLARLRVGQG